MKKNRNLIIAIILSFLMFISYYGGNLEDLYKLGYDREEVNELALQYAAINFAINLGMVIVFPLIIKLLNKKSFYRSIKGIFIVNALIWLFLSIPILDLIYDADGLGLGIIGTVIFSLISYLFLVNKEKMMYYQEEIEDDDEEETSEEPIEEKEESDQSETNYNSDELYCDKCGAKVDEDDDKCPRCGALFIEEESEDIEEENEEQDDNTFACSNCGAKVKESDTKCPNCGESFDDDEEVKEDKSTNVDQKYNDLIKLKELLDKKIISEEEFEKEKKKVLNEKED